MAIMFFTAEKNRTEEPGQRAFFRNLETLIRLGHRCIPSMLGFRMPTPKDASAIACPFMRNASLAAVLKRVKTGNPTPFWTPTGKAIIACGILRGIEFIHSHGAMHLVYRQRVSE
jgi:serine/threonine protein kinase